MTETEKDISRELADYYKEIDRILTEMGKDKESISKLLRDGVEEFVAIHPEAGMDEIIREFGTPEEYVREYISTMPPSEVSDKIAKSRKIKMRVGIACGLVVLVAIVNGIAIAIKNSQEVTTYARSDAPISNSDNMPGFQAGN